MSPPVVAPAVVAPAGWRIACAYVPDFPLAVASRGLDVQAAELPTVLIRESGHQAMVQAANASALAIGIRAGQSASRARARWEGLRCLSWDAATFEAAQRALVTRLHEASPMVVPADGHLGVFWIDARGMRFFGGEPGLTERLLRLLNVEGYPQGRVAVADTAVVAQAASRWGETPCQIVPPGADQRFLSGLSLDALDLDAGLCSALAGLGIHTVAALQKLPHRALIERFGPHARQAIERAMAWDLRLPEGRRSPTLPEVALSLDPPVEQSARLIFGLRGLVERLAARLIAHGLSATRLTLCLRLDDHTESSEELEPARPLHHPRPLFELLRDRLERWRVGSPVVELVLKVGAAQPAVPEQAHLGAARWSPQALEGVLNRLHGRFGEEVVMIATPIDAHRPEGAGTWQPVETVPVGSLDWQPEPTEDRFGSTDPAAIHRILPEPAPITVRLDPEGQPVAVRWAGRWHSASTSGPERLSGDWWTDAPFAREDYRLHLDDGSTLWISRDARKPRGWWLRGWLD